MFNILSESIKENYVFWVCLTISIILLIASFICPPTGVIDSSVLAGVGELFGFAALGAVVRAIEKGVDTKIKKGDTEVTFGDLNKDEN